MENYFVYDEDALIHLRKKDKKLGCLIDRVGIIKRAVNPCLFAALVESVVGQQISVKAAATVCGRLKDLSGFDAKKLYDLPIEEIKSCGMSKIKAGYIKNIAVACVEKTVNFENLPLKTDEEVIKELTTIKGVGVWTAEMLLIFSLNRLNVVSFGDLAIRRGMSELYGIKTLTREKFDRYAKRYAPYGSVASLYLWELSH